MIVWRRGESPREKREGVCGLSEGVRGGERGPGARAGEEQLRGGGGGGSCGGLAVVLDTVKPLPRVVDQVLERGVEGEGAALLVQPDEEIWKQSICRKPVVKLSLSWM